MLLTLAASPGTIIFWVGGIIVFLLLLAGLGLFISYFNLWFQALLSGARVGGR